MGSKSKPTVKSRSIKQMEKMVPTHTQTYKYTVAIHYLSLSPLRMCMQFWTCTGG